MAITRLSGGNTPANGADPRTFPAIWNETADDLEAGDYSQVPTGGSAGEVLVKQSATDFDLGYALRAASWKPISAYSYGHATNVNLTMSLERLYFQPIILPQPVSLSQITAQVATGGSAGAVVRLGIYLPGSSGEPDALLVDAGTIDGTLVAVQSVSISETVSGLIYLAAVLQVAAGATVIGIRRTEIPGYSVSLAADNLTDRRVFFQSTVAGALPANASALSTTTTGVAMRVTIA